MTDNDNGPATLEVRDLHAEVEGKEILRGIDLVVKQGETHALMGPNGSGKSTLSNVIMGRPGYTVTKGSVIFKGENITKLPPDERAKRGLFLAMQYPTEVPGVSVVNFMCLRKTRAPTGWPLALERAEADPAWAAQLKLFFTEFFATAGALRAAAGPHPSVP